MKKIVIIGAGKYSVVVIDIILKRKKELNEELEIVGLLDDGYDEKNKKEVMGFPIIGKFDDVKKISNKEYEYIISVGDVNSRKKIAEKFNNLKYYTLIHPSAQIAHEVEIGEGTIIGEQAVLKSYLKVGKHCILNTNSVSSHHCNVGDYTHISVGSILCGSVTVDKRCFIGAGSTVIPNIKIAENVTVGAGAVVIKDVEVNNVVVGNPAKKIKTKGE